MSYDSKPLHPDRPTVAPTPSAGLRMLMGIACGMALGLLVWGGLFMAHLGGASRGTYWAKVFWDVKSGIAREYTAPRILIVSGSNASAGISAKTLTAALGIPVINIAVCRGYELEYILDLTRSVMQPGDMVLFAPEYHMYWWDGEPSTFQLDYICGWDPGYYRQMPLGQQLSWIMSADIDRFIRGIKSRVETPRLVPLEMLHRQLNEYGDFIANTEAEKTDSMRYALSVMDPIEFPAEFSHEWYGAELMARFAADCRARDVQLAVTFPSMLDLPGHREPPATTFYRAAEAFYEAMEVPLLGRPEDFLYPAEYCFDTIYHLNAEGRVLRTQVVQEHLESLVPAWLEAQGVEWKRPVAAAGATGTLAVTVP